MDPLSDVLDLARVRGALLARVRARDPWGLDLPQSPGASFHAITSGICWLRAADRPPVRLVAGDAVLLPTGIPHELVSRPDGPAVPFDRDLKRDRMSDDGVLDLPGTGAPTTILCAGYDVDREISHPLLTLLPAVLHVPADPVEGTRVQAFIALLAGEVGRRDPGADAGVARLLDLVLIHVVRAWMSGLDGDGASWLGALRDPALARALTAMHSRPGERWTVEALAREAHLSRATLARRFREEVGEPPLAYLTRWRVDLAARRLRETDDGVAAIARSLGYTSEFAFSRAFARIRGVPPGAYRRAAARTPPAAASRG
ncbi:MAG: AraC family transcriptional regulator [Actinomycetota bacterium]